MKGHFIVLGIVGFSIIGDYLLKLASQREDWMTTPHFALGALLYGVSAFGWVLAMRLMPLGSIGVSYAVLSVLALTALGVFVFGEKLALRDVLGILLAFTSLGLMSRVL